MSIRQHGEQPLLERALERMLETGDVDHAAESEVLLAGCDWFAGRNDATFRRLDHALALIADRPVVCLEGDDRTPRRRGSLMLASRTDEAVETGRQTLALAKELGLRELQASALNSIGTARADAGDLGGLDDLDEAFAIASAINSIEALRALGNKASMMSDLGALSVSRELYVQTVELAERLGKQRFHVVGATSSSRTSTSSPAHGTRAVAAPTRFSLRSAKRTTWR
jgi:hypothetical protein